MTSLLICCIGFNGSLIKLVRLAGIKSVRLDGKKIVTSLFENQFGSGNRHEAAANEHHSHCGHVLI